MKVKIKISKQAFKRLKKTPLYIQVKFRAWLVAVDKVGLDKTRKTAGWHDEPLQGARQGQRSIRLNKQWRAIYRVKDNGDIQLIEICEVTPHEY
ncbi:MAG: type II toxin-antitoxin system mRNA interferase toxin, RelE/StbE family [Legionellaceae bacterium]|nr:type II toxin-antitoxin system mRNA interferase toxin, RelE/StbE family [Legionellaceae bacterium]